MKRTYQRPKAMIVDFCYDEQITANSAGDYGRIGDPNSVGLCQQGSPTLCLKFWVPGVTAGTTCREEVSDWSLRRP